MQLDLTKFNDLAKEVEPEHESELYKQMTTAFETIYDLLVTKKIKRKKVIELLKQSGLTEVNDQKMNTWWSSKIIRTKREELETRLREEEEMKQRVKKKWGNESVIRHNENATVTETKTENKKKAETPTQPKIKPQLNHIKPDESPKNARLRRATIPNSLKPKTGDIATGDNGGRVKENKVEGDLIVPWSAFITHIKKYGWNAGVVSTVLVELGIIEKEEKRYILTENRPDLFTNFGEGDVLVFGKVEVYMLALTKLISERLGEPA